MKEQELLQKKKEIETTKTEISELKGEEKALLKQLSETYDCKNLAEAKKKIEQSKNKVKKLDAQIEKDTAELIETYFEEKEV